MNFPLTDVFGHQKYLPGTEQPTVSHLLDASTSCPSSVGGWSEGVAVIRLQRDGLSAFPPAAASRKSRCI